MNGVRYGANVIGQTMRATLHDKGLFYERKYDKGTRTGLYESKLDFTSPAEQMLRRIPDGVTVLDLGSSDGHLAKELRAEGGRVIGADLVEPVSTAGFDAFIQWNLDHGLPRVDEPVDVVLLADVIEHLRSPEDFAEELAMFCRQHGVTRVLVSTGNVAFIVQRMMLLLGQFNYGPRDPRHDPHSPVHDAHDPATIPASRVSSSRDTRHPRSVSAGGRSRPTR